MSIWDGNNIYSNTIYVALKGFDFIIKTLSNFTAWFCRCKSLHKRVFGHSYWLDTRNRTYSSKGYPNHSLVNWPQWYIARLPDYAIGEILNIHKASAVILNTFDELEFQVLKPLSSILNIYTYHWASSPPSKSGFRSWPGSTVGSNLWKEDPVPRMARFERTWFSDLHKLWQHYSNDAKGGGGACMGTS